MVVLPKFRQKEVCCNIAVWYASVGVVCNAEVAHEVCEQKMKKRNGDEVSCWQDHWIKSLITRSKLLLYVWERY